MLFIEFGVPLMTQRGKASYAEKLSAEDARDDQIDRPLVRLIAPIGVRGCRLLMCILFLFAISYFSGQSRAYRQEDFPTVVTSPDMVILRMYRDKLIAARLNRQSKTVESDFRIFSAEGVTLRIERVGPLRAKH